MVFSLPIWHSVRDDGCRHVGRCCAGRKLSRCPWELWQANDSHHVCSDPFHGEPSADPSHSDYAPSREQGYGTTCTSSSTEYSFAHHGTTAMQVTINAQLQLMVDRHSNSSRERERKRKKFFRKKNRIIHLPTAGSIQRQNVSHTAGRVPTDPTTLSCSWDNRSGRGETECARMTRTCA